MREGAAGPSPRVPAMARLVASGNTPPRAAAGRRGREGGAGAQRLLACRLPAARHLCPHSPRAPPPGVTPWTLAPRKALPRRGKAVGGALGGPALPPLALSQGVQETKQPLWRRSGGCPPAPVRVSGHFPGRHLPDDAQGIRESVPPTASWGTPCRHRSLQTQDVP